MEHDTTNKKIIGKITAQYYRTSTGGQKEEQTIETQIFGVNKMIEDKKGEYILSKKFEYRDDGWSSESLARPGLDRMRDDAKKRLFDAVIFYDPSRIGRKYSHQEIVMDELRELGIEVVFTGIASPKDSMERIFFGFHGLFAEYEKEKMTDRFRLGRRRKATEGHVVLSEAPYGFTYFPRRGKRLDPDYFPGGLEKNSAEIENLHMIFDFVDGGLTMRKLILKFQELGIKPRKSKRGVWNTSTLGSILRNKIYIGEGRYASSYAVIPEKPLKKESDYKKRKKSSRKDRPYTEWIKIPVPEAAVIDLAQFERVQERLRTNFQFAKRNTKNEYLISGKLFCSCGRSRVGEGPSHGKYLYYRCTDRIHKFPLPPECKEKGINARIVDTAVWKKLTEMMSSPQLMLEQITKWVSEKYEEKLSLGVDVEPIKKKINVLLVKKERYDKAFGVGAIEIDQLAKYKKEIDDEIFPLEKQLAQANMSVQHDSVTEDRIPKPCEIELFAKKISDLLKEGLNFKEKRAIVLDTIEKVMGTGTGLIVYGNVPVPILGICVEDTININPFYSLYAINRNCRASKRRKIDAI